MPVMKASNQMTGYMDGRALKSGSMETQGVL